MGPRSQPVARLRRALRRPGAVHPRTDAVRLQRSLRPRRARPAPSADHVLPRRDPAGVPAPADPALGGMDRLRRQPAACVRHRQRRGRHRARVPQWRRPAPRPLAQQRPRRRADGAPRGAALAVPGNALPGQPQVAHRGSGAASSLEYAVSLAASVAVHLAQRGFSVRLVTALGEEQGGSGTSAARSDAETAPLLESLAVVTETRRPHLDVRWLSDAGHTGLLIAVLGERLRARPAGARRGCGTRRRPRWRSPSTSTAWSARRRPTPGGTAPLADRARLARGQRRPRRPAGPRVAGAGCLRARARPRRRRRCAGRSA